MLNIQVYKIELIFQTFNKTMETYLEHTNSEESEPILREDGSRFTAFPVKYPHLYDFYKKQVACFWTPEEVDLSRDGKDWKTLSDDERHFIKMVLAFFAASDGIVMENLSQRFMGDVKIFEAQANYAFQINIETVHSIMYSLLIEAYISDTTEKTKLFSATSNFPCVKKKADWAFKWLGSNADFKRRIVAFSAVEGIFFSGSFCAIYWLKQRGILPGLTQSNEFISRDEGFHTTFAVMLHELLEDPCTESEIKEIISECVAIEKEFITEAIPVKMIGMNSGAMSQYIEFVADFLLSQYGLSPLYGSANPFPWMELISVETKTNFFEKRVTDYQRPGVLCSEEEREYKIMEDF
jgi:ribonucleotide reductase beta subunit family protein with ferritin-like domain